MPIRKLEIERLSLTSSKPFESVIAAIKAAVGHPNMVEFFEATRGTQNFAELETTIQKNLGRTGLMLFMELDHGAILRRDKSLNAPKMVRFLIGNPLIMSS